ncbi:SH3 domain-containing protein [Marinifilum sp. N1E240]|uniref:SH3 domain-containing protein n=1 Tax=Marinifilum sp. N1E240 TaxID=2608082 RepID=UPI00128D0FE5|nr:SH3 domain-containing protein [Marinifilum sp. N1E240]MPQ49213.1 SH3 domain-containing protein [Marinifilum sp. N1E240]
MKLKPYFIGTCIILMILCFTSQNILAQSKYSVTVDNLNIRKEANTNSFVTGKLHKNNIVVVSKSFYEWKYISYNGKIGWVNGKYLKRYRPKQVTSRKSPWYDMSNPTVVFWWIMLGMTLVLYAGLFIGGKFLSPTGSRILRIILLLITSAVIAYYFTQMERSTWFFDTPRWWRDVVNFMLFFLFVMTFSTFVIMELKHVSEEGGKKVNPSKAILGIAITTVIFVILNYIFDMPYKMGLYIIGGILIYITFKVVKNVRFLHALLYLALFSLLLATLGVIGYYCTKPFIILSLLMISGGGAVSNSENESSGSTEGYSGEGDYNETYEEEKSVNIGGSKVELEENWQGDLSGNDGNDYEYTSPFKDKVRRKD